MQIANWINKINYKKPNFIKRNQKSKDQREERYNIVDVATRVKHQVSYVRVTSIPNDRLDIKIDDEIRVTYDCVIKMTFF